MKEERRLNDVLPPPRRSTLSKAISSPVNADVPIVSDQHSDTSRAAATSINPLGGDVSNGVNSPLMVPAMEADVEPSLKATISTGQIPDLDVSGAESLHTGFSLKALMGTKEENERIDIKASLDKIERWPTIKRGYSQLGTFLVFFGLYCCVMVLQINPELVGLRCEESVGGRREK